MKTDLSKLKCKACSGNMIQLNDSQISEFLSSLNNWTVNNEQKMIFKKYSFKTFKKALDFTNLVGYIADEEGHHPDISFGWGYAKIVVTTHAIEGLSENDFILAAKIDQIFNV